MAAVFGPREEIRSVIARVNGHVSLAAVNAPDSITVSGADEALAEFLAALDGGIKWQRLAVSHAFHSPAMAPMLPEFRQSLAGVESLPPQAHFYSTVTADRLPRRNWRRRDYWARQILEPVRFAATIEALSRDGYDLFLEIGPVNTLSAFARRSLDPAKCLALSSLQKGAGDWRTILATLGELFVHGQEISWEGFDAPYPRRKVALPTYPFQRTKYWVEVGPGHDRGVTAAGPKTEPIEPPKRDNVDTREQIAEYVAGLLSEASGLAASGIDRKQNLMEMGLDSLMLVKVAQLVERRYGVELQFGQFFRELSSIDGLSAYLLEHGTIPVEEPRAAEPVAVPVAVPDAVPPAPPQPAVPVSLAADPRAGLFQQQLLCMSQIAAQNMDHMAELARQQLAALGVPAPSAPPPAALWPPPTSAPAPAALWSPASSAPAPAALWSPASSAPAPAALWPPPASAPPPAAPWPPPASAPPPTAPRSPATSAPAPAPAALWPTPASAPPPAALWPPPTSAPAPAAISAPPPAPCPAPSVHPAAPPRKAVSSINFRGLNLSSARPLTPSQRQFVDEVVQRHVARTGSSKELTRKHRAVLADWKHTLSFWGQLKEAKYPIVSARSEGARFWDLDGHEYIDVAMGMGVHFFGHKPAFIQQALARQMEEGLELGTQCDLTGEVAQLIHELTGVERVAFSNTGTEAVMVALRLARAATRRNRIALFRGSYHGIFDGVLAAEEDGAIVPVGLGTPPGMVEDVMVLEYGSPESLASIAAHAGSLAAVLVEPAQSRNPDLQPQGFLKKLRRLTAEKGIALIFDEMITGFRIHPGGAQAWFGVEADIVTYGKISGGGLPIGVIAGKRRYLDHIDGGHWEYGDQSGPRSDMIFFGGTFGRNPVTMAAAHAALLHLKECGPGLQQAVSARTTAFCDELNYWLERERVPLRAMHFASQWRLVGLDDRSTFQSIETELLWLLLMAKGVYTWERRICFFSEAHGEAEIAHVLASIRESVREIRAAGFPFEVAEYRPRQFGAPSSTQRRQYALCQRPGGQLAYHLPSALWIDGPLDLDRMEDCFREVIHRHESLRTGYSVVGGDLVFKIESEPLFSIERYDCEEDRVDAFVPSILKPFDLGRAPLVRVAAIRTPGGRTLLVVNAQHIAADGLSFNIIAGEIMSLYEGRPLAAPGYDFRTCVEIQEQAGRGAGDPRLEAFWRAQLSGDLPLLDLPADFPRPRETSFEGGHVPAQVSPEIVRRLKALAGQNGATLYMLLLAAYNVLLHRLTLQEDILVGGPASGRTDPRLARAVGMFVNTLVYRNRPRADLPFRVFLEEVKGNCAEVYNHQDYPFESMTAWNGSRPSGRNPIFDTMLSYEDAGSRAFEIQGLRFTAHDLKLPASMFDLRLDILGENGLLNLDFSYSTSLFSRETVSRWAGYFQAILTGILEDPDRPLGLLDLAGPEERALIDRFNATSSAYPSGKTIAALFEEQVRSTPRNTAVECGAASLTYAELNARANGVARFLRERRGIRSGEMVAVFLERSEWAVIAILGILKAGAAYVPLDTGYPAGRLEMMLRDSASKAILSRPELAPRLPVACQGLALDITSTGADAVPDAGADNLETVLSPDSVAYVIYTSGSTGVPKGCAVTHRNVVRLMKNDRHDFDFHSGDVWTVAHSFCFDFSVWEMYGALLYGGCAVIAPEDEVRDAARFRALIERHGVTILNQTPGAFYALMEEEARQPAPTLASLRSVIFGGDRLEPARLRAWVDRYPLGRVALVNMYGITETTVHVTCYRLCDRDVRGAAGRSLIGRPIPETTLYVCDAGLRPMLLGVPGELYVGGSGVSQGYLNRPELTAERFVPSPFRPGERLYRTGDVGRLWPDGNLEYLGRNDQQVQVRGYRVELGEVTGRLLCHPGIHQALVVDREGAGGTRQLAAYLVGPGRLNAAELRLHLSAVLPDYMIPSHFVQLDRFPLTENGKVDRAALPTPEKSGVETGSPFAAARNPIEEALVESWRQVLGRSPVSIHDDYFALGGDSIKALQIVSRLHRAGIRLELRSLFEARTIAALTPLVGAAAAPLAIAALAPLIGAAAAPLAGAAAAPPAPDHGEDRAGLTPIQRWFFAEHSRDVHHFNQAVLLKARERLSREALLKALAAIHTAHAAFRTRFAPGVQELARSAAPRFEVVNLRGTSSESSALAAHAGRLQASFDLAVAPLAAFGLYRLSDGDRLLLVLHHLIVNGVSWRILFEDLGQAYQQALRGDVAALGPAGSYFEFARAQAEYARTPALAGETAFWTEVESVPALRIPPDFDHPGNRYSETATLNSELDESDTEALLTTAHRAYNTAINDLLLTALARAAKARCGMDRMRLLVEGHGREAIAKEIDITRTVGWFTSLYPVALDLTGAADLGGQILKIKSILRRIPDKGIGYGILRYLTPGTSFGRLPEFGFNYLGQFDGDLDSAFSFASEPVGSTHGGSLERTQTVELEAVVTGRRLHLTASYNPRLHKRETIQRFLDSYTAELRAVIRHCAAGGGGVEEVLPLSPLQEGMLFHALESQSQSYFEQFTYLMRGDLDVARFAAAWNQLARRHSALRTAILGIGDGKPVQAVLRNRGVEFEYRDLRPLPADQRAALVERHRRADRARGFDLERDPLMRVAVLQTGNRECEIVWSHHHIILDGWSVGIVQQELAALYGGQTLPPAPPYSRFLDWLSARDHEASRRYWAAYLDGCGQPARIPGLDTAGRARGWAFEEHTFHFDKDATAALASLAARHGVTMSAVLQAAWSILLGAYNGSEDVVFGVVASGRPPALSGVESIVGLFLDTAPVRVRLDGRETLWELARRIQAGALERVPHHHFPLSEMQMLSGTAHTLFDHVLVFENYPFAAAAPPGLTVENVRAFEQMHYDFSIVAEPLEELEITFKFNANVAPRRQMALIEGHLRALIASVLRDSGVRIAALDIRSEEERSRQSPPAACRAIPLGRTVLDRFEDQVEQTPGRIAVESGSGSLTYLELDTRANSLAHCLRAHGLRTGDVAGIFLPNGSAYLVSILAVMKAGGVFVPLDVEAPPRRFAALLAKVQPKAMLTAPEHRAALLSRLEGVTAENRPQSVLLWNADEGDSPQTGGLDPRPAPADTAYIMFTSGSTGEPKAILGSHEGLDHFISWEKEEIEAGESVRVSNLALTTFDVSLRDLFLPLVSGGAVSVPEPGARLNASLLLRWLDEKRISVMHVVPSVFRLLLREMESAGGPGLPHLRWVLFAGEPLYGKDVVRARQFLASGVRLMNLYGPSETSLAKAFLRIPDRIGDPARMLPIGGPIPGTRIFLVKDNRPVATGAIGEICIQPPFRPKGYLRDPERNAAAFVPSPLGGSADEIVYRTGDLGRQLPDGNFEFIGRQDRQVKINGVRLELGEIDRAMASSPEVNQSLAVAHKQADGELVLAVYFTEKSPVSPAELRRRLAEVLPPVMIPAYLVRLDRFPLNINGKIDCRALPKPEALIYDRVAYQPPAGEIEAQVAAIWADALGLERVGVLSPYFEVGGNSLRAVRIIGRINRELGAEMTIRAFFELPTVREQAARLSADLRSARGGIQPLAPAADYALSSSQRRLWILDQLGIQSLAYSIPAAYLLTGPLNVPALTRALETLVERHESLRTTFFEQEGEPRQRIHPKIAFAVEVVDLGGEADPEAAARRLAEQHAGRAFDLSRGPLFRASLLTLAPLRHVLLVNLHHIVCDAESISILARETWSLYHAFAAGAPNPLAPLAIHYKDFAAWQNAALESETAAAGREYWKTKLAGPLDPLALPTDRPRPALQSFRGDSVRARLPVESCEALRRFSREQGGTLFMSLVSAVKALLYRYSGQEDIIVGIPVSNRNREELSGQIGFYSNSVALRDRVRPQDTLPDLFRRVKTTLVEALEHQQYPFDRLLQDLAIPRDPSRAPIFEVMVVLQDAGQRELSLEGVAVSEFYSGWKSSKFTLTFEFFENRDGGISLNLEYDADLFERATIERLRSHLAKFIENAMAEPGAPLASIDILPEEERRVLELQNPAPEIPTGETITGLFEDAAARWPQNLAVICENLELTYAELNQRANRVADALAHQHGVQPGEFVAVLLPRSEWTIVAFLGILKCGAVYIPIDPGYPAARIAHVLSDSGCSLVIADAITDAIAEGIADAIAEPPCLEMAAGNGRRVLDVRTLQGEDRGNPPRAARGEDPAYVIYTSGSTGRPKGVLLGHAGAVNLACAQRLELGILPGHRILQFAPSSFDASVWEILMTLAHGACLVIAGAQRVADPRSLADYLRHTRVTVATLPPSYLAQLSDHDLETLEILITAGEPPHFERALGLSRRLRYFNAYGPTEATVCATWQQVDPDGNYPGAVPIGHPIMNSEVFVLDRDMNLAPIGVPGEIYIGGRGLALGYLNQPGLTSEAFVPDPRRPGHRLYRSGDLGRRLPDGALLFMGRNDSQVKVRGHRIELGEIERCLLQHPDVKRSVVIARATNGGDLDLVAYFESDAPALTAASLRDHLRATVPPYMIPSSWVQLPAMPLLPNGKVDRDALPPPAGRISTADYAAPRNDLELRLSAVWRDVLHREGIGIHDRFFEAGGDSIKAIQLVSRLRSAGHDLDMREFFETATIASLAAMLGGRNGDRRPTAPRPARAAQVSLTPEELVELFPNG